MLREKSNDAQAEALKHDDQTLQDRYQVIPTEWLVHRKHYETLYEHYQALLERCPTTQGQYPDRATFRQTLHTQLIITRIYRSNQNGRIQAGRPLLRKTILLGVGNEKDATFLRESVEQARAHRVFLAADCSQALSLVQNVHIDVLVLGDGLNPLSGIELDQHLHCMKG
jgi:hypothetical protein